jgi:hypothetical protein
VQRKRTQNRVSESRIALPLTGLYAIGVCLASGLSHGEQLISIALLMVSAMLIAWLNNANVLIRIYSRMVSCAFLLLSTMAIFLVPSWQGELVGALTILSLIFLFNAYQDKRASGLIFYSFAALSTASIFFVQILYFVPLLWILLMMNLMAMTFRHFIASILGILAPYWFIGGYYAYLGGAEMLVEHFIPLIEFSNTFDYQGITDQQIITFAFVVLLSITGAVHFIRTSYKDKIRVRMLFDFFIVMSIATTAFIVIEPQHFDYLLRMLIIFTSPLIGHFISLTNTKVTNIAFYAIIIITLAITVFNIFFTPTVIF